MGGTATWIARLVTVVCRDASSLVKWLRGHNAPGMIGIGRLHAGVAEPVVLWYRRVQAPPMWLGKEMISLSPPPRRTVRTSHLVHGSSNLRTPRGALLL
jgi:hypothetical protein